MIGTKVDFTFKRQATLRVRLLRAAALYRVAEITLWVLTALALGWLLWVLIMPTPLPPMRGPIGTMAPSADLTLLTQYDPFHPGGAATAPAAGAGFNLKLFGIRADRSNGHGSAIIATPDGLQASFAVGDEIVPGVMLKAVAQDYVLLTRSGAEFPLYLDQTAQPPAAPAEQQQQRPGRPVIAVFPGLTAPALKASVKFTPQLQNGLVTGFTVEPSGSGFASTGLMPGDVITDINDAGFRSVQDIDEALTRLPAGMPVLMTVIRGGNKMTLGTRPAQ